MEWLATVDRFENGSAILLPRELPSAAVAMARELLPPLLRNGQILRIKIEIDHEAGEAGRKEISDLQEELSVKRSCD